MKKIAVKLSNERLITPSGLTLVGGALGKSALVKRANRMAVDKSGLSHRSRTVISCSHISGFSARGKQATILCASSMQIRIISRRHWESPIQSHLPIRSASEWT